MACIRLTLIEPVPGGLEEVQDVLSALDEKLASQPGLIFSFVTSPAANKLCRITLWRTRVEANRVAARDDVLALRSKLRALALDTQEVLIDLRSGYAPETLASLLEQKVDFQPVALSIAAVA